ncbi:MAG: radical SAM protein [Candidatus Caccovivens sp.]
MKKLCENCPRQCQIDRNQSLGFCNENKNIKVAKIIKNFMWEEPCITGEKGALAIFFSGCNLKCDYCQNYKISRGGVGTSYSADELREYLEENQSNHSYIDLITPTHFSDELCKVFENFDKKIPIVWNTNSYETIENIKKVCKFVDIFLADLKYSNDKLGQEFSKVNNYFSCALPAIKQMCKEKPDLFDGDLMMQGVILRHLVLPEHLQNSFEVLDIIKQEFSDRILSLMSQFTPNGKSSLNRKLKPIEYKAVISHMEKLGLKNGYLQDFESASECMIPDFD